MKLLSLSHGLFFILSITTVIASGRSTTEKYAFAHVVVGDTAAHSKETWEVDIALAAAAGLDAFALDIAYYDPNVAIQVKNAFEAAESLGSFFKLFFSFDYLGGGLPWPANGSDSVVSFLQQYGNSNAYFKYEGQLFASTFEGTSNIDDWEENGTIRSAIDTGIYFVPVWTSLGPSGIIPYLDVIQGTFSWNIWPVGATDMTDAPDLQWIEAIGPNKTYIMGVSPWFFHSASGGLDWIWRGDSLWHDRWLETVEVNSAFVEVVTWNDWGESHYIGPLHNTTEIPDGSEIYDLGMPHDGWRNLLPYYIAQYKGKPYETLVDLAQYWYRLAPATGGSTCGVQGNDYQDGQPEVNPNTIIEDDVFFTALLIADATLELRIGDNDPTAFTGVKGINHFSQPFNGQTGPVSLSIIRDGFVVEQGIGASISSTTDLSNNCTNYNAWVGSIN
jgi:glucan endo-1,3-alpha-glucosidase